MAISSSPFNEPSPDEILKRLESTKQKKIVSQLSGRGLDEFDEPSPDEILKRMANYKPEPLPNPLQAEMEDREEWHRPVRDLAKAAGSAALDIGTATGKNVLGSAAGLAGRVTGIEPLRDYSRELMESAAGDLEAEPSAIEKRIGLNLRKNATNQLLGKAVDAITGVPVRDESGFTKPLLSAESAKRGVASLYRDLGAEESATLPYAQEVAAPVSELAGSLISPENLAMIGPLGIGSKAAKVAAGAAFTPMMAEGAASEIEESAEAIKGGRYPEALGHGVSGGLQGLMAGLALKEMMAKGRIKRPPLEGEVVGEGAPSSGRPPSGDVADASFYEERPLGLPSGERPVLPILESKKMLEAPSELPGGGVMYEPYDTSRVIVDDTQTRSFLSGRMKQSSATPPVSGTEGFHPEAVREVQNAVKERPVKRGDVGEYQGADEVGVFPKTSRSDSLLRGEEVSIAPEEKAVLPVREKIEETLQPRDRTRDASVLQMQKISQAPDYNRLSESKTFDGAPMVIQSGGIRSIPDTDMGKTGVVVSQDGEKIPFRYAVVEADKLLSSHDVNGSSIAEYSSPTPGDIQVVVGNGRAAGLKEAYRSGNADDYWTEFNSDIHNLGIAPEAFDAKKNPVLVRVFSEKQATPKLAELSNAPMAARMSPVEQAFSDANKVGLHLIDPENEGIASNNKLLRDFLRNLPESEQMALVDKDGRPTKDLIDRVHAAIFAKAYRSEPLLELLVESLNPEIRNIISAMMSAAPRMSVIPEKTVSKVSEAALKVLEAKHKGMTVDEIINQGDMFKAIDPDVASIARFFDKNKRSSKKMASLLEDIVQDRIEQMKDEQNLGMFGDEWKLKETPIEEIVFRNNAKHSGLFGNQAGFIDIAGFGEAGKELWRRFSNFKNEFGDKIYDEFVSARGPLSRLQEKHLPKNLPESPMEVFATMPGRKAQRLQEINDRIQNEIINKAAEISKKHGIDADKTLNAFLHATVALERNARKGSESSSGMTSPQARRVLEDIAQSPAGQEIAELGGRIFSLNRAALKLSVDYGLITPEDAARMARAYQTYAPLFRDVEQKGFFGSKRGIDTRSSGIYRAMGSDIPVRDIIANELQYLQGIISRGENNRVILSFADSFKKLDPEKTGVKIHEPDANEGFGARSFDTSPTGRFIGYRDKGIQKYIEFEDPEVAMAMKMVNKFDPQSLGVLGGLWRKTNEMFKELLTKYSVGFSPANKIRDIQDLAMTLTGIEGFRAKRVGSILKGSFEPKYAKGILDYYRKVKSPEADFYRQFLLDGGTSVNTALSGFSPEKAFESVEVMRSLAASDKRAFLKKIENMFTVWGKLFEDTTRMAVYEDAMKNGESRVRAAARAKKATIDFDDYGKLGSYIGMYKWFSPIAAQSVYRAKKILGSKAALKIAAGIAGAAAMSEAWNSFIDPDWKKKVNEKERAHALTFMIPVSDGASWVSVPLGWMIKPYWSVATSAADVASGYMSPEKVALRIADSIWNAVDIGGGANSPAEFFQPSIALPLSQIEANRRWTGSQIKPEYGKYTPEHSKYYSSLVKEPAGKFFINLTKGASNYGIEVSPADLQYLFAQYTGSAGRELTGVAGFMRALLSGDTDALSVKKVPIASRFYKTRSQEEIDDMEKRMKIQERKKRRGEKRGLKYDRKIQRLIEEQENMEE